MLEDIDVLSIKGQQLKDSALKAYRVLCDLILESSFEHIPRKGMPVQNCIKLEEFKDHFFKAGIADTDKPDSVAKAFLRCKNKLKGLGYIGEWDKIGYWTGRTYRDRHKYDIFTSGQTGQKPIGLSVVRDVF